MTTTDPYAFTNANEIGPECDIDPQTVPLDVWCKVVDLNTKTVTNYVKRKRMRTLNEVYQDLYKRLDVVVCEKCGAERPRKPRDCCSPCPKKCGGETYWFIDEYFAGPNSDGLVPHDYRWIACYPVTGGSEGHYVHIEFGCPVNTVKVPTGDFESKEVDVSRQGLWRVVRLALGKTFRGMDHAAEMARRCAKLLGA